MTTTPSVDEQRAAEAPSPGPGCSMRGAGGDIVDMYVARDERDLYTGDCPSWCVGGAYTDQEKFHGPEGCDENRGHFGEIFGVPVRSMAAEYDESSRGYVLGHAKAYLRHRALYRDPEIWLRVGDSNTGFEFQIDEAEQVGLRLARLVVQARGAK